MRMMGPKCSPQDIVRATLVAISGLILLSILSARSVSAEQLPVRIYTTADGLPRDLILRIVRDSHGFLWFCTGDGLSRFNGYEFTNYGVEQGLSNPRVNNLIETRSGVFWVATENGISRFNPTALPNGQSQIRTLFTAYPPGDDPMSNRVEALHEDHSGRIWAGTHAGLFRLEETTGQATFRRVALSGDMVVAFAEDSEGSLWMSTTTGLDRRLPDGGLLRYATHPSGAGDLLTSLLFDTEGRLCVGHRGG